MRVCAWFIAVAVALVVDGPNLNDEDTDEEDDEEADEDEEGGGLVGEMLRWCEERSGSGLSMTGL